MSKRVVIMKNEEIKKEIEQTQKEGRKTLFSNKEFAQSNKNFQEACEMAKVKPTTRQASKYRNQKGSAFTVGLPALKNKPREEKTGDEKPETKTE